MSNCTYILASQGLLFSTNECLNTPTDMIRIWLHECQRVYGDKLIDDKDIDSFTKMQTDIVKKSFEEIDESIVFDKPNIFCHFAGGIGEFFNKGVSNLRRKL